MSENILPLPHKIIGVAVIWNEQGNILIDRRRPEGLMGGLWEFPGGKLEADESIEDCIKREISEELGIVVEVGEHLITIDYTYSQFHVTLNVYHCCHKSGEPQPLECDEIRWVTMDELDSYNFPTANFQIIKALRESEKPDFIGKLGE